MTTKEQVIAMAREAGFRAPAPSDGCMGLAFDYRDGTDTGASLSLFATLVRNAALEEAAKKCHVGQQKDWDYEDIEYAIRNLKDKS